MGGEWRCPLFYLFSFPGCDRQPYHYQNQIRCLSKYLNVPLRKCCFIIKKRGTAIRLSGNDCQRDGRSGLLLSTLSLFLLESLAAGILAGPSEKGPDSGGAMRRAALSVRVSGGKRGRGQPQKEKPQKEKPRRRKESLGMGICWKDSREERRFYGCREKRENMRRG